MTMCIEEGKKQRALENGSLFEVRRLANSAATVISFDVATHNLRVALNVTLRYAQCDDDIHWLGKKGAHQCANVFWPVRILFKVLLTSVVAKCACVVICLL